MNGEIQKVRKYKITKLGTIQFSKPLSYNTYFIVMTGDSFTFIQKVSKIIQPLQKSILVKSISETKILGILGVILQM